MRKKSVYGQVFNETFSLIINHDISDNTYEIRCLLTNYVSIRIVFLVNYIMYFFQDYVGIRIVFLVNYIMFCFQDAVSNIIDTSNLESKKIISEMSILLNKLQVSTTCQTLHPRLKHYLKLITKTKPESVLRRAKEMEGKLPDENQNRDSRKNFVFTSPELTDNLEDKANVLKGLLNKFNNLPEKCKPRALPLKEYIENHINMVNNVLAKNEKSGSNTDHKASLDDNSPVPESDQNTTPLGLRQVKTEKDLVEQQLESLGLGEHPNYKPNFDLNELIAQNRKETMDDNGKERHTKEVRGKDIRKRHSESYEKLLNAIARERMRKIRVNRLGQMYGKFKDDMLMNEKSNRDVNSFESPLVYSF